MTIKINTYPISGSQTQEEVSIYFEGKEWKVRNNQSVCAALMSNGIKKLGISKKLEQPLGGYCLTGRCYSCMMTIDGKPHVRACMTQVKEGMNIKMAKGYFDIKDDVHEL